MQAGFGSCRRVETAEGAEGPDAFVPHFGAVVVVFIRFQGAILLGTLTAVAGSVLESAILEDRRALVRQHYRVEALRERVALARLRSERLSSLAALVPPADEQRSQPDQFEAGRLREGTSSSEQPERYQPPLLRWRTRAEER